MMTWKRLLFVTILMVALIGMPPAYNYAQGNLTYNKPLPSGMKTDAIMVFTGQSDRLVKGYSLYLGGLTKKLMITGTDYKTESRNPLVRKLAKQVDKRSVYVDLMAKNTIENAENGAAWAIESKVKSVLLVTSEGHMARAYFELRRRLPKDVALYTEEVPGGTLEYAGVDSENARLYCRLYETTLHQSFCYETRELARNFGF